MRQLFVLLLAAFLIVGSPVDAGGGKKKKNEKQETSAPIDANDEKKSPFKPFDKVTKDAEHKAGFFDFYQTDENLYVLIPESRLGSDFLFTASLERGIANGWLNTGTMLDWEARIVAFERQGDRIFLKQRPTRFTASHDEAIQKTVALSYGDTILEETKIVSIREENGEKALLIDIQPWLLGDMVNLQQNISMALAENPRKPFKARLDKGRSHLEKVASFPENANVSATLTFSSPEPATLDSLNDGRFIPLTVYHVFAALPETPMETRIADERLGFFPTVHKDYAKETGTYFERYTRRWRLEPGEKVGDLYLPKKPIVYYLEDTIPEKWRPIIKEGVEAWNAAFEKAGFKDAIRAEMLPEGADPEDIRYPTIRWVAATDQQYGAIGPSVVDPRTGEILDADILIENSTVMRYGYIHETYRPAAEALDDALNLPEAEGAAAMLNHFGFAASLADQSELAAIAFAGNEDGIPKAFLDARMKFVTMHEVGHTLGLYHNFRATTDTPLDHLDDRTWAEENGLYSSVMDYPSVNLGADGNQAGYYYTPTVGSYDRWVISYGYTPDPEKAAEIARQVAQPGHAFANDGDARGPGAVDPNVNVYDLGSDPMEWGKQRAELIDRLWQDLPATTLSDNDPYNRLTQRFGATLREKARCLAPAVKTIGGQYAYRDRVGDPNGRKPFEPVPRERQLKALDILSDHVFSESAFDVPQELLTQLGGIYHRHWGAPGNFDGRNDFPFTQEVLQLQERTLMQLTDATRLARMRDAEMKFGQDKVLTIPELFSGLSKEIWSEVTDSPGKNINHIRRDLQRAHLDRLIAIVSGEDKEAPADARAIARHELKRIEDMVDDRLKPPTYDFDAYTRAHLEEIKDTVDQALDAEIVFK